MEFFGAAITLLTGLLGVLAWRNGRWMKQAHHDSLALLAHIQQGQEEARRYIADFIVSESEKTRQILRKSR